jgi:hypothetical protein
MRLPVLQSAKLVGATFALFFFTKCAAQISRSHSENNAVASELTPAEADGRWGYVDSAAQFFIKPKYFAAAPFKEDLALVVTRKPWEPFGSEYGEFRLTQITYIDRSGHEIRSPLSVRRAASFSDGMAVVVPDSSMRLTAGCAKGGYLNTKGKWGIEPQFDGLKDFSEGLAAVNLGAKCGMGGKWGYITKEGKFAIPLKFLFAGQFHDGRACVTEKDGEQEVIDKTGVIVEGQECQ